MRFGSIKKWLVAGTILASALAIACSSQADSAQLNRAFNVTDNTIVVADTGPGPSPIIEPDVLYQAELDGARFDRRGWETDFSRHTVSFKEIFSGGVGRDGIPPIDNPQFETIEEAESVMDALEPVVTFKIKRRGQGLSPGHLDLA